ncbi:MAG: hypothetical protein K1X89_24520 [Myxococcaceae bacterium]|nr:hypothetical protein [Myxococcaceae bacterium]
MAGLATAATCLTLLAAGGAELRSGEGAWKPIAPGAQVAAGDQLRVQGGASAWVSLNGGWMLQLAAGAEARLGTSAGALTVGLARGEARLLITRGNEPASLSVEVPGAAPAMVQAAAAGPLQLRLTRTDEALELVAVQGQVAAGEVRLGTGQGVLLGKGVAPTAFALLDAPVVTRPAKHARFHCAGLLLGLAWTPVPHAVGYRVQLSADAELREVTRTVEVAGPRAILGGLPVGRSFFRVSAKDEAGHWGLPSEVRPLPCEADPPEDALLVPAAGAELPFQSTTPTVTFTWAAAPGARAYRLVVAKGPTLDDGPVVTQTVAEPKALVSGLPEGSLVWGVFLDDAVPYPLFVEPRALALHRRQAAGVTAPKTIKDWGKQ